MQELRFVAVSEDCRYAVLAVPGRSARFTLPIDERLRAVALGQTSRLAQYEIEVESPLRPKEIQARIRAGETVEEIADAAGIAAERVRWFEGPVLAERAYMADQAQLASVRRQGDATPGPRLGEIVTERLKVFGADPEDAQWDAKKRGDSSWQVELTFISGGRLHTAEWMFDPRRRHVLPADDNAARMSLPGAEPPLPAAPAPGEATITHLAPRLNSASAHGAPIHGAPIHGAPIHGAPIHGAPIHGAPIHGAPIHGAPGHAGPGHAGPGHGPEFGQSGTGTSGFGPGGTGNGGRARHERPASGRPAAPEPQVVVPAAPEPRETEAPAAAAPSVPSAPPVSPAAVAAQISRAGPGPQPGRASQAAQPSQPGRDAYMAQESRVAQPRQETAAAAPSSAADSAAAAPAAAARPAAPAASAPSPAEAAPSAPADSAGGQGARQGRKAARGKRSSVPSWDEIMFGSSRQRD